MARSLTELPAFEPKSSLVSAIVETPRGHRAKLKYDAKHGAFAVDRLLPEGMAFPFDFGFIPSTKGDDGDPVDVLILIEEAQFPGSIVPARLIGVIEGMQTEANGERVKNDRLLAVAASSVAFEAIHDIGDLSDGFVDQIEAFFIAQPAGSGKVFRATGRHGSKRARELVMRSLRGT